MGNYRYYISLDDSTGNPCAFVKAHSFDAFGTCYIELTDSTRYRETFVRQRDCKDVINNVTDYFAPFELAFHRF